MTYIQDLSTVCARNAPTPASGSGEVFTLARLETMSVSQTVVALADLIEARIPLESARERLQLEILRQMPLYVQIWDLPAWESAFTAVMEEDDPPEGSGAWVLWEVFDFGRCNLYAAFVEAAAKRDYDYMRAQLRRVGIDVPESPELSDW